MIMRFRGGGVGHTSTRAATNVFKTDRDDLDMKSRQLEGHQEHSARPVAEPYNVEERDDEEDITTTIVAEDSEADIDEDSEGELSESEVFDYGYQSEDESGEEDEAEEEREDGEGGEEDDMTIDELDVLGYADY
jgi:hypothetical protein